MLCKTRLSGPPGPVEIEGIPRLAAYNLPWAFCSGLTYDERGSHPGSAMRHPPPSVLTSDIRLRAEMCPLRNHNGDFARYAKVISHVLHIQFPVRRVLPFSPDRRSSTLPTSCDLPCFLHDMRMGSEKGCAQLASGRSFLHCLASVVESRSFKSSLLRSGSSHYQCFRFTDHLSFT